MPAITAKPITATPITARPLTAYRLGESTEGAAVRLVWHAAYYDPATYECLAQLVGEGSPAFTNSGLSLPDWEANNYSIDTDTPPWKGARKVTNIIGYSEDFSNGAWSPSNITKTTGITDPNGGTTAATFTATASNGAVTGSINGSGFTGKSYCNSVWIRRRTGTGAIIVTKPDNVATDITASLTTSWQRFSFPVSGPVSDTLIRLKFQLYTSGDEIDVAFAQIEEVTGQSNQNPGEYIPTTSAPASKYFANANGNTVASNVVTEASGALLDPLPMLYGNSGATAVFDSANWNDSAGALYLEVSSAVAQNILSTFLAVVSTNFQLSDGTNTATKAWVADTVYPVGVVWSGSEMALYVGSWTATAAYDGSLLSGSLDFFRSASDVGLVRNVQLYNATTIAAGKSKIEELVA